MKQALEHETDEQAAVFSALADPTRLKLVKLLCAQRSDEALCVNALAARLGVTQSAVSQHLRVLKAIDLVNGDSEPIDNWHDLADIFGPRVPAEVGAMLTDVVKKMKTARILRIKIGGRCSSTSPLTCWQEWSNGKEQR